MYIISNRGGQAKVAIASARIQRRREQMIRRYGIGGTVFKQLFSEREDAVEREASKGEHRGTGKPCESPAGDPNPRSSRRDRSLESCRCDPAQAPSLRLLADSFLEQSCGDCFAGFQPGKKF